METQLDYTGMICQDASGNIGIASYLVTNCPGQLPWEGVNLLTGKKWFALHPKVVATNIDAWVRIRYSDLISDLSWGMIQYAESH